MGSRGTQLGHPSNPGREGGLGQPSVSGTGMRSRDHLGGSPSPTPVRPVILLLIGFSCQDFSPQFRRHTFSTNERACKCLVKKQLRLAVLFSVQYFFLSTTGCVRDPNAGRGSFIFRHPRSGSLRKPPASSHRDCLAAEPPRRAPSRAYGARRDCPTRIRPRRACRQMP